IAVTAGGTTIANDQKITFAVDPGAEQTVAGAVVKPTPPWLIYAITAFVFVALLVVLSALTRPVLATARHRRRLAQVGQYAARALPDALTLVIGSLRSGFALPQALDAMVKETTDPISTEFSRALTEVRLGADLEDALDRTATRMRSKDLSWTVMAIRIQREVG